MVLVFGLGFAVLTLMGWAQPRLCYQTDDRKDTVVGVMKGGMVRQANERLVLLEPGGEFCLERAGDFAGTSASWQFTYTLGQRGRAPNKMTDEVSVSWELRVKPERDQTDFYMVRAWMDDGILPGKMIAVSARPLGELAAGQEKTVSGRCTIPYAWSHGRLMIWLFQAGRPIAPTVNGAPAERDLASATLMADADAVEGARSRGAKFESLPAWIIAYAWASGSHRIQEAVLQSTRPVEVKLDGRRNLLHLAADLNRADIVPILVQRGVDLELRDEQGRTPLQRALYMAHGDVALALLTAGAKPQQKKGSEPSSLSRALDQERPDVVDMLRAAGAQLPSVDELREKLLNAAADGNLAVVGQILAVCKTPDIRKRLMVNKARPILNAAVVGRNPDIVTACIAAGADVEECNDIGHTPLMAAAQTGQPEMIELLLRAGAKSGRIRMNGHSALSLALQHGDMRGIEMLLAAPGPHPPLDPVAPVLWESAVQLQNAQLVERLQSLKVPLAVKDPSNAHTVELALAAHFSRFYPVLGENGWNGETRWMKFWRLYDLARWFGCDDLMAQWGAPNGTESGGPPLSTGGHPRPSLFFGPPYPEELRNSGVVGGAEIEFYLSPEGEVVLPRIASATHPAFGISAQRAIRSWVFRDESKRTQGWRRLTLPFEFSEPAKKPVDLARYADLDEVPVPVVLTSVQSPSGWPSQGEALAVIAFDVGADGKVGDKAVVVVTDARWRQPLLDAMPHWQFRPGVTLGQKVATRIETIVWLPQGNFSSREGFSLPLAGTEVSIQPVAVSQKAPTIPQGWSKKRGLCGVQLTVSAQGEPTDVRIVSATEPELAESSLAAVKKWRFKAGTVGGRPTPMTIRIPIVFEVPQF